MEFKSIFNRKTALGRMASLLLVGAAAVALQGVAYAHSLTVTSATPGCNGSQIVINFTVTAWAADGPGSEGDNSNRQDFLNGVLAASGAFSPANGDIFSGTANAPAGTSTVQVTAEAVATWGDGSPGGEISPAFPVDLSTTSCGPTPPPGTGRFTGGGKVVVSN